MEAAVAEREEEMVEWDDGRLDERFRAIDQRFDGVDRRMDEGFARMDEGFRELNGRFDSLQRTLIQIGFGFGAALVALIAALIGTIATQL
jgi:tetrahydromethanopterin S-methyltransferase subunit B